MHTKETLLEQLKTLNIDSTGTLLVHASLKSIGDVEGRADTVLDALSDYMKDGLLVLPTHTWADINAKNPKYYVEDSPSCIGILPELWRKREGVVRSLHPTHSVGALGKDKEDFIKDDELYDTPCSRKSPYGKLLDRKGTIMLIGVDLRRNTFIHGVEEWADIPGRLSEEPEILYSVLPDGTEIEVPSYRHHGLSWSEHYWKVDDFFLEKGVMRLGKFGDATVRICDTVAMTDLLFKMLEITPEMFTDNEPLDLELYKSI